MIGTLLASLVCCIVWNRTLERLAKQRGRQLMREQIEREKASLKTEERTRLAVELHDSLSQTLTGVAMQIEAARDFREQAPSGMTARLDVASKALKSCRDELRNCLWDLRSQALEEREMSSAIMRTLQPHVDESVVDLSLDFNVPRSKLSDNTAHALLRTIRELVLNAVRHGGATKVTVSGSIADGHLTCTVSDNGCGFDPDVVPGVAQGHFGLQGIQERIADLNGKVSISSSPRGSTISISIPI